jgi:hypothetical protein
MLKFDIRKIWNLENFEAQGNVSGTVGYGHINSGEQLNG